MTESIVPFRSTSDHPTRRALLAGAAVAPVLALPAVALAAPEADPHVAWFAEWRALVDWMNGPRPDAHRELAECPQYQRYLELEELIHGTPARTLPGVLAQLRVLDEWFGQSSALNATDAAGLANALATVERLTGSVVA